MRYANLLLLLSTLVLAVSTSAHAQEESKIIIMDAWEYDYINHSEGKMRYLKSIAPLLQKLEVKTSNADLRQASGDDLARLIIDFETWNEVVEEIDRKCQEAALRKLCASLAQKRADIFDYIKSTPEE